MACASMRRMLPASPSPPHGHDPLEGVDADGCIVTGAHASRMVGEFKPVIDQALARFATLGAGHSLYLYGSVATGTARVGSSDVDFISVGLDPAIARRVGQQLSVEFAQLCRAVEVGPAQARDHEGPGDQAYGNRVFLRHYAVHLAGPDLTQGWPACPADAAAARGFNGDIGLCAERWCEQARRDEPPSDLGRRMARKTLLAVAGLVSIHDSTWTTDRRAAARRWGELRPAQAGALQDLVAWSDAGPSVPAAAAVQAALEGVVADVVDEFRQRIGLWA